jgi:hypothetical protein
MNADADGDRLVQALIAEADRRRAAEAKLDAVRKFADEMRDYCSPHGVSAIYADRLEAILDAN